MNHFNNAKIIARAAAAAAAAAAVAAAAVAVAAVKRIPTARAAAAAAAAAAAVAKKLQNPAERSYEIKNNSAMTRAVLLMTMLIRTQDLEDQ
jgi:hypothetical protein